MTTGIVLFGKDAAFYEAQLAAEFPEFRFHVAHAAADIAGAPAESEALVGMAPALTEAVVGALPRLRWIGALTTGVDNLLLLPKLPPEVVITRVRGIHGPQMSELALLDMMLLARDMPRMLRNQAERRWERWPQRMLLDRTAVILGVGSISEELAPRCKAFGMRVIGISARTEPPPGFDAMLPRERLAEAAAMADFLVLLIPYAPQTHHIIDAAVMAAMKPDACIVNIARGAVLDEAALNDALRAGRLGGAALDVFATEPLSAESPLWDAPNLVITPHVGGMSDTYAEQALPSLRRNLQAFRRGDTAAMENRVQR